MYLYELESELYQHFNFDTNPPPEVVNRFRGYINTTYKEMLGKKGMSKVRRKTLPFPSVANSPYTVLPQSASRIISIQDRTNMINLGLLDQQDFRRSDPGQVYTTSTPYKYAVANMAAAVAREPSDASELFVKSTSAADGVGVDVRLAGIITGGYQRTTHGPMNGTTATTVDAAITSWIQITKFSLNQLAKGTVTLHEDSGAGTELARITIGRASARYTQIQLYPTPSAVVTYYADVDIHVDGLFDPMDEPVFDEDYHWVLSSGAMMREYSRKRDHVAYAEEKARFKEGVSNLQLFHQRKAADSNRQGYSQLGPYYQRGT